VIWPNRNTTATNPKAADNGMDKKSMLTKNAASAPNTTFSNNKVDKFAIKEIYPTKVGGRNGMLI
jgi:hypothetical protein